MSIIKIDIEECYLMNEKNVKLLKSFADKNIDVEIGQEVDDSENQLNIFSNLNIDEKPKPEVQQNQQGSETYYEL